MRARPCGSSVASPTCCRGRPATHGLAPGGMAVILTFEIGELKPQANGGRGLGDGPGRRNTWPAAGGLHPDVKIEGIGRGGRERVHEIHAASTPARHARASGSGRPGLQPVPIARIRVALWRANSGNPRVLPPGRNFPRSGQTQERTTLPLRPLAASRSATAAARTSSGPGDSSHFCNPPIAGPSVSPAFLFRSHPWNQPVPWSARSPWTISG